MRNHVTRRDFLKLAGLFPLSVAAPRLVNTLPSLQSNGIPQNIIIIVFDALSAYNISLYGYPRKTAPNLDRLAERAIVYHNHYASGNFTTPGTASLLTGTYPWTHRAFQHRDTVEESFVEKNLFSAFPNFYRITYSHNPLVNVLASQFRESIDDLIPRDRFLLKNILGTPVIFNRDEDIADVSWVRTMNRMEDGFAYSLFLSHLYDFFYKKWSDAKYENIKLLYPRGIPGLQTESHFLLEDAIDWLRENLGVLPQPFVGYFHFLPPHAPYRTHKDFYGRFGEDGLTFKPKRLDIFSEEDYRFDTAIENRTMYDEFILYVDREFGRLFDNLENSGLLENTWIVLTSDHGEMFERGVIGHSTPLLYEPVIRVPLMIFEPRRNTRLDVHTLTSAVDVLPTLLHVTGQSPALWTEGSVLPPYSPNTEESIFVLEAKKNKKYAPLTIATTALVKGQYKLMYFFGYDELDGGERIELYDIEADPEEMTDLYSTKRETVDAMLHELKTKLQGVNGVYK